MEKVSGIEGKIQKFSSELDELQGRVENFKHLVDEQQASELHNIRCEMLEMEYKSFELLLDMIDEALRDACDARGVKKSGIITDDIVHNLTIRQIEKLHQIAQIELGIIGK